MIKMMCCEGYIRFRCQYSYEHKSLFRNLPDIKWNQTDKYWVLPYSIDKLKILTEIVGDNKIKWVSKDYPVNESILNTTQEDLVLNGYSHKTIKNYMNHLRRFTLFLNKTIPEITDSDIRGYLLYLLEFNHSSHSHVNQAINSIKYLFDKILKNKKNIEAIPRPRKQKKLPNILSQNEVIRLLNVLTNEKHKTILFLIYSAGLRVSEVNTLTINDIDSERMLIRIKQSKGRKDRYTILSDIMLEQLRKYYKLYKPEKWLFPGARKGTYLSARTIQRVFESAKAKANIKKNVSVHSLRHSFATHLLENGTDLRYIQELLGHNSSKTTEIYTHVTKRSISNIKSPLDSMATQKQL